MASRYRSISKSAVSLLKSSTRKPNCPVSPTPLPGSTPSFTRIPSQMGSLQSLLPFHSAVSSARLTSCLGVDSRNSRSLSQGERLRSRGSRVGGLTHATEISWGIAQEKSTWDDNPTGLSLAGLH